MKNIRLDAPSACDRKPPIVGKAAGFTLIERLVVIAGITILAGMLLPALSKAKGSAQRNKDVNNEKQLSLALNLHVDEFAGKQPVYASRFVASGNSSQAVSCARPSPARATRCPPPTAAAGCGPSLMLSIRCGRGPRPRATDGTCSIPARVA